MGRGENERRGSERSSECHRLSASLAPPPSPPPLSGSRSELCEVSMEPEQSHLEWGMCSGSAPCSAVRAPIVWQRRRGQARAVRRFTFLLFSAPPLFFFLHPCSAGLMDEGKSSKRKQVFFSPLLTSSKVLVWDYWPPALVLFVLMPLPSLKWITLCSGWLLSVEAALLHHHTNNLKIYIYIWYPVNIFI